MSQAGAAIGQVAAAQRAPAARWKGWPLAPALLFLLILFVYPVGQLLWLSVVDRSGAFTGQHYARLFASSLYVDVLLITLKISVGHGVLAARRVSRGVSPGHERC